MSDAPVGFSSADAAAELRTFGSTVMRDAWRLDHLTRLREAICRFFEIRGERITRGEIKPSERMLHTHGAGMFLNLVNEGLLDPSMICEMFAGSDYHRLCAEYFDDDAFYVNLARLAFRRHDPCRSDRTFVPFHQDSGSQDERTMNVLNCWIPLDPGAGRDAPGLEVVRTPSSPNFPLKDFGLQSENAVYDFITIDKDKVAQEHGDLLLAPTFNVGDALVFSQDVIHRTHVTPEMTRPRINFELRVFSMKHLAPGVSPANVLKTAFRVA